WVRLSSMGAVGAGCVKEMVVGGQGFVVDGGWVRRQQQHEGDGGAAGGGLRRRRWLGEAAGCSSVLLLGE
ncbi:hypothetical protein Dimus_027175, partial [Dionaea muscipula]